MLAQTHQSRLVQLPEQQHDGCHHVALLGALSLRRARSSLDRHQCRLGSSRSRLNRRICRLGALLWGYINAVQLEETRQEFEDRGAICMRMARQS